MRKGSKRIRRGFAGDEINALYIDYGIDSRGEVRVKEVYILSTLRGSTHVPLPQLLSNTKQKKKKDETKV